MILNSLHSEKTLLMGILNTTPDSFSDGGKFVEEKQIYARINQIIAEGAEIIDIGGESSAPDSQKVSAQVEIQRILSALQYCQNKKIIVSVDTYKSQTAQVAIDYGAKIINDVTALRGDVKMAETIAQNKVYVVLMYSKDCSARTTSQTKNYQNTITEIKDFLAERIDFALKQGISKDKIILDTGMGAFISREALPSLQVLKHLKEFKSLNCPLLIGTSRKSFIGDILDLPVEERLEGSLATASIAVYNGAKIIRTHDVLATKKVIKISEAIRDA